jgi:hypothetical protein
VVTDALWASGGRPKNSRVVINDAHRPHVAELEPPAWQDAVKLRAVRAFYIASGARVPRVSASMTSIPGKNRHHRQKQGIGTHRLSKAEEARR